LKKYIKSTPIKSVTSTRYAKGMVKAEPTKNRTAGIDTNHSTMFTLLLKLIVICEQLCIQSEL